MNKDLLRRSIEYLTEQQPTGVTQADLDNWRAARAETRLRLIEDLRAALRGGA